MSRAALFLLTLSCTAPILAQDIPALNWHLNWRMIGSFRAGRVTCVAGVPGQPSVYYFGTPGGGVWKTDDGGQVWNPIFDRERVPSIGAIAVAPSNPNVVYVGTGEQTVGRGVYRSNDAGKSWKNIGLADVPYIQSIVIDPQDPDSIVVGGNSLGFAILWRPLPKSAKTANRGIFKTVDGGRTWTKMLMRNDTLGVFDLTSDPANPRTLYASLYTPASGPPDAEIEATSEIVRSLDGGTIWKPLASRGLPEKGRGRVGIAVASGTGGRRIFVVAKQGFYRSDDAGATFTRSTKDPRVVGSSYFSRVFTDTRNPDILYVAQTSLYRSTDGGRTFHAYVGAPSGDDFHVLWISPRDPAQMILGIDQGAIVSMNAGKTWSSWYNQPTGQYYHVSTDNAFPYHVYAAQQDSGTQTVPSRSDYGQIMNQDAMSIGGFEYSFIAPDPQHPELVFSGGWYGTVVRFNKITGQVDTVFERGERYRVAQMAPLAFNPLDPRTLYLGTQFVLKTTDRGQTWQSISADLTGYGDKKPEDKPDPDQPKPPAITALAPSHAKAGLLWAGTSNRLVHLTRDAGANWVNVTPPGLPDGTQVLTLDASWHDPGAAYLVVGATRESTPPLVLRTHDSGANWTKIVNGFPEKELVRVVREDSKRPGLLYAGTDSGVFVSWDDGDHWRSLALNMPATPVTDLEVHGNDLVASTFGRSLWILDNISALREIKTEITSSAVHLFQPAAAMRVRWDNNQDTPYPPETPAGQNPPEGAMFDYWMKSPGDVAVTIFDSQGKEIRRFATKATEPKLPPANAPEYWFAPVPALPSATGVNRFTWDLRYEAPKSLPYGYDGNLLEYTEYTFADHAIPGRTPRVQPQGILANPGRYTVELRAAGQTIRREFNVTIDPRVRASQADLAEQLRLARQLTAGMQTTYESFEQIVALNKALSGLEGMKEDRDALSKKLDAIQKGSNAELGFGIVNRDLTRLLGSVESGDTRPAEPVKTAVRESCDALSKNVVAWRQLNDTDLPALNAKLRAAGGKLLPVVAVDGAAGCGAGN